MGSTWKNALGLSIFGESHGAAIGMTLDGLPAGEQIDFDALQAFLNRRAPGNFPWTTARKEADIPEFLSGIYKGYTTGAPITATIENTNTRSGDYGDLTHIPRPGHADYTAEVKYGGFQDPRGGGHFSGRLTAALCIAGGICLQILERRGITIGANINSVGDSPPDYSVSEDFVDAKKLKELTQQDIPVLIPENRAHIIAAMEKAKAEGDSIGGSVQCAAIGVPAGLGDPMFYGMENRISSLLFAIPAVKSVCFGSGLGVSMMYGSEMNGSFYMEDGQVKMRENYDGGIQGGITNGMKLSFWVAIKPTPSIAKTQQSINLKTGEAVDLNIQGRHDPCIVPRAVPVIEAAAAIAIYDAILEREGKQHVTR